MRNKLAEKLSDCVNQLYFGSGEEKTKGKILVDGIKYYYKIQDWDLCKREMSGYGFVKKYYPVPEFLTIVRIGDTKGAVISIYDETIGEDRGLLVDIFSRGVFTDNEKEEILKIIDLYNLIFKKTFTKSMHSASDIFFIDRIKTRIEKFYDEVFIKKTEEIANFNLNGFDVKLETGRVLSEIKEFFKDKKETWCIISQCDPNDLNIGTKPIIFDYLAGGVNPLMAEFATLFWYNIAQGEYLSLKYNKESFHKHERMFLFQSKLEIKNCDTKFHITDSRKYFLINYIEKIVQPLYEKALSEDGWECWYDEFKNYLAMKIIGVFDVSKMEHSDMLLSLGFLQFFHDLRVKEPNDLIKIIEKL